MSVGLNIDKLLRLWARYYQPGGASTGNSILASFICRGGKDKGKQLIPVIDKRGNTTYKLRSMTLVSPALIRGTKPGHQEPKGWSSPPSKYERINIIISNLDFVSKNVIISKYKFGYTAIEGAQIMGMSPRTYNRRLSEAKTKIISELS